MKYVPDNHPGRHGRGGYSRMAVALARRAAALGLALLLSACEFLHKEVDPLPEIARGGDYQDWDALRPAIKDHLQREPDDPLGHYLYGLSYLHQEMPELTLAEGEFLTARNLLARGADYADDRTGLTKDRFAAQIHRKTALTYMRGFREAMQFGLPQRYGVALLQKAYEQVELGLAADPQSGHLKEYQQFLRGELGLDGPQKPEILTERAGSGGTI